MDTRYEEYERFVQRLISRTGMMKTEQLSVCLQRTFENVDAALADAVLKSCQRHRILFLSRDGYALTAGTYIMATGDRFLDDIDFAGDFRIAHTLDYAKTLVSPDVTDALWIAADMMPGAMDFMVSSKPWILQFVMPETEDSPSVLYQIAKLSKGREIPDIVMLEQTYPVTDRDMRRQIRRIALLDRQDEAWRIPYVGFSHICLLDESRRPHFRVIGRRSEREAWKDYD